MSIDYTTILAQIVNFTVLAWALYKFLYKPLLAAIAAREKHIADEVKNAEDLSTEAEIPQLLKKMAASRRFAQAAGTGCARRSFGTKTAASAGIRP